MVQRFDLLRYYQVRLGWAGVLGACLLLGSLIFLATAVRAKQAALEQLILSNQALHQAGASEQARAAREASAVLPGQALAPEAAAVLRRLHDAAGQSGLELAQGEYRLVDAKDARLRAYQFMFPVYGSYSEIREFLALALNNVPALALSSLRLRRESVESPELDAALGFTLYLEAAP